MANYAGSCGLVVPGRLSGGVTLPSNGTFDQELLDRTNCLRGVQSFWTGLSAIHDGVTAIKSKWIFKLVKALARHFVAAIRKPSVRLQKRRGPEKAFRVPPVVRAAG